MGGQPRIVPGTFTGLVTGDQPLDGGFAVGPAVGESGGTVTVPLPYPKSSGPADPAAA